ncbi:hypothetical protein M8C13_35075 [Crossiella sp. SN42]|uniref:hypothetical protein n=1 Tax=Crossiella sp. SN42 TaxID=2944808 RepID=UPI00207C98F9|nr:hypothetical protein [Crossiella sp. SN42]MCO1580989.1 hypothetical protein [Crossiella sp. SN42]
MLFTSAALDGIATGAVTLAFRRWRRPSVRAGTVLRTAAGLVEILAVEPVEEVGEDEAVRAGFADRATLLRSLRKGEGGTLYRVELRLGGADPRVLLREQAELSEVDRAAIARKLSGMDSRAKHGPWTAVVLGLIAECPGVRAAELAARIGRDTVPFKNDVRKLKELGLTESLEVGYRLSPRGEAYLRG